MKETTQAINPEILAGLRAMDPGFLRVTAVAADLVTYASSRPEGGERVYTVPVDRDLILAGADLLRQEAEAEKLGNEREAREAARVAAMPTAERLDDCLRLLAAATPAQLLALWADGLLAKWTQSDGNRPAVGFSRELPQWQQREAGYTLSAGVYLTPRMIEHDPSVVGKIIAALTPAAPVAPVTQLVNLTPHAITIDGATIEPSGTVARVSVTRDKSEVVTDHGTFAAFIPKFGPVVDLPETTDSPIIYIVSAMVRTHPDVADRGDVASPGQLVRDASGAIIGCDGLDFNF